MLLTIKDWLWSNTNPYPYAQSAATTGAALAGFFLLMVSMPALFCRVESKEITTSQTWVGRFARPAAVAVLAVVLASLFCFRLKPEWPLEMADDLWLGRGMQAAADKSTLGTALIQQWGLAAFILLGMTIALGVVLSSCILASQSNPARSLLALIGGILLYGLVLWPVGYPFLTGGSIAGTWALSVGLGLIGLAAAPATRSKPHMPKNAGMVGRKLWAKWLPGLVLSVAAVVIHLYLVRHIMPYARVGVPAGSKVDYVPLRAVSQSMQDATVAMEDGHFYSHRGLDWAAMHRALRVDLREGRIKQGGSTISQQLAKNLFLTNDRTLGRKLLEAAYTIELEQMLSKKRILELYLNTIDYGMGCHGISAAASYYFHTTPDKLTLGQSAILVGLAPSPPQVTSMQMSEGEPYYEDLGKLAEGQQTALSRIAFFFPARYSQEQITQMQYIPLDRVVYPYKDAWDRGATSTIPPVWHGVSFYFFADRDVASGIGNAAPSLMPELAAFLDDARRKYLLTGVDHLGVYNDRGMRQAGGILSAHAFGQAIDISGFRFSDGSRFAVKDHNDPKVLCRLLPMESLLKRHFDIVVDWKEDPLRHQTHFHCEVRGPRPVSGRSSYAFGDAGAIQSKTGRPPAAPTVRRVYFVSRLMGNRPWGFSIFLPPGYAGAQRHFPVVYFCPGYNDDDHTWVQRGLALRLQYAMLSSETTPMIVVFINGDKDSGFNDEGASKNVESYVTKELIPYVDLHFRTIANRSGRAVEGFSMGGYGALKFAYKYPDLFNDVVAYSQAPWFSNRRDNDLSVLVKKNPSGLRNKIRIRLVVGLEDNLTLAAVRQHHKLLDSLGIPNEYEEVPNAGHSLLSLYDADSNEVGLRGLQFHAAGFGTSRAGLTMRMEHRIP